MSESGRFEALTIEEDLAFQRREWHASLITWIALLIVMFATGIGAFGNGPLSHARIGDADGPLWIEYERVARFGASLRMTVHVQPQADGTARVIVSRSMLEAFRFTDLAPKPAQTRPYGDDLEHRFMADGRPVTVIFSLTPLRRWWVEGRVESPNQSLVLRQFIYP